MSRYTKVTDRIRARVAELHKSGASIRSIAETLTAEGMGLSKSGVALVLEELGKATPPPKSQPATARPARRVGTRQPEPESQDSEPPPPDDGDADEELDPEEAEIDAERAALDALLDRRPEALPRLPIDASLAAKSVWWDLVAMRAEAAAMRLQVRRGKKSAQEWKSLMDLAIRTAERLADLLPVPPPDASKDPANIKARAMLHNHVVQAVEAAEARAGRLCPRCLGEVELALSRSA